MNVRIYLINDAITNETLTLLRMVGPDSPPDVGRPRHSCYDYLNNT